ncbi:MAG: hypothetical protein ACW99U_14735 [Candidatus Thorarchaeota archaeon]
MSERSRFQRFDEVYQIVLIIVALSFDILWFFGYIPAAEIAVFVFVLIIWAYGNLRGGIWEYPMKLGSFNLSLMLQTRLYFVAMIGRLEILNLGEQIFAGIALPLVCVLITLTLARYLGDTIDRDITMGMIVGGTFGYVITTNLVVFLGIL